ncbi:MAG TPA: alpha/beta hydrolase [Candidatus Binataceae bacterium]|nr:alpha/beta hydrolase [Candidatus Binataceae bacterium]
MATLTRPDGTRIYYLLSGKDMGKPPLVMIHGWCSSHELWASQVKHFGKRHRILLLDRRGHGKSTTSGTGHDAATHASDIAAVTIAAGLRGVVAIGHAGGGAGTLEFIRANPRLIKAGVLVDTSLTPLPKLGDPSSPFGNALGQMIESLKGPKSKSAFKAMYSRYFNSRGDRAANARAVAQAALTPDAVKIAELEGLVVDTAAIADGIKQPVLWLTASQADQSFIRSHLKDVGFAQVYGANHFPQFEQPAQTNAMLETFLSRI